MLIGGGFLRSSPSMTFVLPFQGSVISGSTSKLTFLRVRHNEFTPKRILFLLNYAQQGEDLEIQIQLFLNPLLPFHVLLVFILDPLLFFPCPFREQGSYSRKCQRLHYAPVILRFNLLLLWSREQQL